MDTSFAWDQHFVTGLDAVDEQHHALVDLFNELSQGLFSKRSDREVVLADTYARLLSYTEHHFQEEEALMAQYADGTFSFPDAALARTLVIRVRIDRITGKQSAR
jgi:hemerythrin